MTDTYKVLGQSLTGELALDNSTVKEAIAYEVPAGTKASVSAITITNSDIIDQTYRLSFVPSAEVSDSSSVVTKNGGASSILFSDSQDNSFYYSDNDGQTWTSAGFNTTYIRDVIFANNKVVGIGYLTDSVGTVHSADGVIWQGYTMPDIGAVRILYQNGTYIAPGSGYRSMAYSTDAITWTVGSVPSNAYAGDWIAYGNGVYISGSNFTSPYAYSIDGTTWIAQNGISGRNSVIFGNGKFVGVGYKSIAYSTDGINWTECLNQNTTTAGFLYHVSYVNGVFVAAESSSNRIFTSTNGEVWTEGSFSVLGVNSVRDLSNDSVNFYALVGYADNTANVIRSSDGISWTNFSGFTPVPKSSLSNFIHVPYFDTIVTESETIPVSNYKHMAIYNKTIASGETHEIKGGVTLSAGDQIRVYSDSTEIITNVYGVEIA